MTLYARADVISVCVPVASGGCGTTHIRPVRNGAPAQQFKLDCPGCENFLRADIARTGNKRVRTVNADNGMRLAERFLGLWGATPDTIPEAPDQEQHREWAEQETATSNASSQTDAMRMIGTAVAGNSELMAKFIELQTALLAKEQPPLSPILPVPVDENAERPEPRQYEYPIGALPESSYDTRTCRDCGALITRSPGQKGALAHRCPDCRGKKAA